MGKLLLTLKLALTIMQSSRGILTFIQHLG